MIRIEYPKVENGFVPVTENSEPRVPNGVSHDLGEAIAGFHDNDDYGDVKPDLDDESSDTVAPLFQDEDVDTSSDSDREFRPSAPNHVVVISSDPKLRLRPVVVAEKLRLEELGMRAMGVISPTGHRHSHVDDPIEGYYWPFHPRSLYIQKAVVSESPFSFSCFFARDVQQMRMNVKLPRTPKCFSRRKCRHRCLRRVTPWLCRRRC
jgi:hypothetical protein